MEDSRKQLTDVIKTNAELRQQVEKTGKNFHALLKFSEKKPSFIRKICLNFFFSGLESERNERVRQLHDLESSHDALESQKVRFFLIREF